MIAQKWVKYVTDADASVRTRVADVADCLLRNKINSLSISPVMLESNVPEELNSFVDLVVYAVLDGHYQVVRTKDNSLLITLIKTAKNLSR